MDPNAYIKNLVETVPAYNLSSDDKKCIQFEGVEKYIYNKLASNKFRNSAIPEALSDSIKKSVKYCISNKLPIHIMFPFGAYKRWNLPTHPGIDFAEVFNMALLREYLAPIAAGYEHGVILHYYSVELFVERNNHIPQENINFYEHEFLELMKVFTPFLPKNMQFKFTNLREEISQEDALNAVDIKVEELRKNWINIPEKDKELKIKRAKVNCKVDSNSEEYEKVILEAVFVHDAFSSQCWDKGGKVVWITGPDMITIGNSYTGSWGIHIKSSQTSRVNFWVGFGALIQTKNSFLPTILSQEQYTEKEQKLVHYPISFFGMKFKSLKSAPVLEEL
jgi:hypothetical protein